MSKLFFTVLIILSNAPSFCMRSVAIISSNQQLDIVYKELCSLLQTHGWESKLLHLKETMHDETILNNALEYYLRKNELDDARYNTLFLFAARHNWIDFMQLLYDDNKSCLYAEDTSGKIALHIAAFCGNLKSAVWLISLMKTVDILDKNENTPLHLAVFNDHVAIAKLLLNKGANRHVLNKKRTVSPAIYVTKHGSPRMRKLFEEIGITNY